MKVTAPEPRDRPRGLSSRMRPVPGFRRAWTSPSGPVIDMPVVFDLVLTDPDTGAEVFRVEALVGCRGEDPALLSLSITAGDDGPGLDVERLQREFRWATPIEAVTRLAPLMVQKGMDPYAEEFPSEGFPDITRPSSSATLTDEFLEDIAREYLNQGRGYAQALATRYSVTRRTVVSWVEKARARGILSPTTPGRWGGSIVPRSGRARV